MMMLIGRSIALCSRMKHYREIAAFLDIKVPLINQEIALSPQEQCIVYGIKKITIEQIIPVPVDSREFDQKSDKNELLQQVVETELSTEAVQEQGDEVKPEELLFEYDEHSQETVSFEKAISISSTLDMDLSLMKAASANRNTILTLSRIRKHIYSEYNRLFLSKRTSEHFKHIKVSQKIEGNDKKTKHNNILRMFDLGERYFRLQSDTDSQKAAQVLVEFARQFGKEVEPYLQTFKEGKHGKRKYKQKWAANLIFEEEIPLDYERINKKWKKRLIQQRLTATKGQSEEEALKKAFQSDDINLQRELFEIGSNYNIKLPGHLGKMAQVKRQVNEGGKMAFYRTVLDKEDSDEFDIEWDSEEERLFKKKNEEFNKTHFNEHTVEDILNEMETLKQSGYESQPHKMARFNELKGILTSLMRKNTEGI